MTFHPCSLQVIIFKEEIGIVYDHKVPWHKGVEYNGAKLS